MAKREIPSRQSSSPPPLETAVATIGPWGNTQISIASSKLWDNIRCLYFYGDLVETYKFKNK